jgi:hypothetical protein
MIGFKRDKNGGEEGEEDLIDSWREWRRGTNRAGRFTVFKSLGLFN